jgi:hypothetical protein
MRKVSVVLLLALIMAVFMSCASGGAAINVSTGIAQATVTDNTVGTKVGEAATQNVLGIAQWGDASVSAAAKNGGITKVATVDQKKVSILGLYVKKTTIVTGE